MHHIRFSPGFAGRNVSVTRHRSSGETILTLQNAIEYAPDLLEELTALSAPRNLLPALRNLACKERERRGKRKKTKGKGWGSR